MSARKSVRKTNKSRRRSISKLLVPLSPKEIQELTSEKNEPTQMQLPVLDALGRKIPKDEPRLSQRITVMEEPRLDLPELWLSVYIHGPEAGPSFNKLFARCKCFSADKPDEADVVVFTGSGHDIDPILYGAQRHNRSSINPKIDEENMKLFHFCKSRGIPMFGVCGGAQLIHVAQGGSLFQHVDGHSSAHSMYDCREKSTIQQISSVHHQLCRPNPRMEILGVAHTSRERWTGPGECFHGTHADIEAFWYRDISAFGVQGHPEYMGYSHYTVWCMKMLDTLINGNPDLKYRANGVGTNRLRLKEELVGLIDEKETPPNEIIIVEQIKGK